MKVRILSDIHSEFYRESLFPVSWEGEDVLILAGDIGVGVEQTAYTINRFLKEGVPEIVFVAGNHEYYGHDFDSVNKGLKASFVYTPSVHILHRNKVLIGGVSFIGATLWTNFDNSDWNAMQCAKRNISDFHRISREGRPFSVQDAIGEHEKDLSYIRSACAESGKKIVITHFLPMQECISDRFKGNNPLNHYFANNLGKDICGFADNGLLAWVYGHSHDSGRLSVNGVTVIANPAGYPRISQQEGGVYLENALFSEKLMVVFDEPVAVEEVMPTKKITKKIKINAANCTTPRRIDKTTKS